MAAEDLSKLKIDKAQAFSPGARRKPTRWIIAGIIVVAAVILSLNGVFTPAVSVEAVSVVRVYPSQTFTLLNASGYVVAQRKAAVASKITSPLVSLSVEEGNRVKKGEVIARLEGNDAAAARDQAAANLNVARFTLEQARAELQDALLSLNRSRELVAKDFIAKSDYDTADARYKKAVAGVSAAEASVNAAKAALHNADVAVEYTLIRAPFDGVVLTKNADVGDIVTPLGAAANAKASVFTLADMNSLQVEVDVSESNLEQVKVGQPCEIQLDAFPESRFRGVVHMIVPTADRTKATVLIKVSFLDRDERVLPEMSAKVAFLQRQVRPDEQRPRTAINPAAVMTRGGKTLVFLIRDNRVTETPVSLGSRLGDMVEVLDGLKPGSRIALKPLERLRNGSAVKIVEK
jgi:RND family efflux transporter MFP subunit